MPIRTLLFDLGNVLVHFSHERMCEQIAGICNVDTDHVRRILFDSELQPQFERGELSEAEFHRSIEQALGRPVDFAGLRRAGADIFELNEPIVPLLDRLKSGGYRLVLLSNTCVTHYEWVRHRFDLLERFDACVLSFQVGALKPDRAIFRSAFDVIGCHPAECFYTDDVAAYVEQGRRMGLEAEVFTDVPSLVGQLQQRGVSAVGDSPPVGKR